jgi:K+ transporter
VQGWFVARCSSLWFFGDPGLKIGLQAASISPEGYRFRRGFAFAARDLVARKPRRSALTGWRIRLFAFLYRNSAKVVDRLNLPPDRVIEIARQIEI